MSEPVIDARSIRFLFGVLIKGNRRYQMLLFSEPVDATIPSNLPNPSGELSATVGIKSTDRRVYPKQNISGQLFGVLATTFESSGEI